MVTKVICLCSSSSTHISTAGGDVIVNPLNPLSEKVRARIYSEIRHSIQDTSITSILLYGGGPHFSAGADITYVTDMENMYMMI